MSLAGPADAGARLACAHLARPGQGSLQNVPRVLALPGSSPVDPLIYPTYAISNCSVFDYSLSPPPLSSLPSPLLSLRPKTFSTRTSTSPRHLHPLALGLRCSPIAQGFGGRHHNSRTQRSVSSAYCFALRAHRPSGFTRAFVSDGCRMFGVASRRSLYRALMQATPRPPSARLGAYQPVLSQIRRLVINRMAKPEEVALPCPCLVRFSCGFAYFLLWGRGGQTDIAGVASEKKSHRNTLARVPFLTRLSIPFPRFCFRALAHVHAAHTGADRRGRGRPGAA